MGAFTGDLQVLLYTTAEQFAPCRDFYAALLEASPYYTWDEGPEDCGAKFHAGRGTISVLCQEHRGPVGPSVINLETADVEGTYRRVQALPGVRITQEPVVKPYGTHCFSLLDPCGNQLNLYHSNH